MDSKPKRTDFSRISKKTKSGGVRFTRDLFERVKKEHNLKTAQQVLILYERYWEQGNYPMFGNPVMQRQITPVSEGSVVKINQPKRDFTFLRRLIPDLELDQECRDFQLEVEGSSMLTEKEKTTLLATLKAKWS